MLFGSFQLETPGGGLLPIANARARAILAMLCTEPEVAVDRALLSELLWPGRFTAHAKASLRQCLFELGKLLEPLGRDLLIVTRSAVGLAPGAVETDLGRLEHVLRHGDAGEAIRQLNLLGSAQLIDRMDFGDAFRLWRAQRRGKIEQRLRDLVSDRLAALEATGERESQVRLRDAWARRDPDFGQFDQGANGSDPSRLAVLPFRSIGTAETQDYFTEGMAEELIVMLGRVPRLRVTGRTSAFHFRDSELDLKGIAAALNVSHLVEGTVQCSGPQVRIHVHLIDGATGFELWGERYAGSIDDIFALQEQVASAVTAAISSALGISLRAPPVPELTRSKQAYDLFLQGRSLCARRFGEGVLETAIAMFEQAVDIDPDFAECWVALAEAHQLVSVYTQCLDRNGEAAKMAECAKRALALNPRLGYAHSLLGLFELTRFNFVGALEYGFKGYALEPGDPSVALRLGCYLAFIGRTRDAAPYIRKAVDLDPVDGRKYAMLWGVHFCQGNLPEALAAAERMVDLGMMAVPLGATLAAMGEHELAVEKYVINQNVINGMILPPVGIGVQTPEAMAAYWTVAAKGICSGQEADRQTYWQVLEMLFAVLHDKSDPAISGPAIFTGHADLAYRTIGQKITPANLMALVPLWTPVFPICRIWQHPEFIPFAQRIGMAEAWDKYGWPDLLPPPSNLRRAN